MLARSDCFESGNLRHSRSRWAIFNFLISHGNRVMMPASAPSVSSRGPKSLAYLCATDRKTFNIRLRLLFFKATHSQPSARVVHLDQAHFSQVKSMPILHMTPSTRLRARWRRPATHPMLTDYDRPHTLQPMYFLGPSHIHFDKVIVETGDNPRWILRAYECPAHNSRLL